MGVSTTSGASPGWANGSAVVDSNPRETLGELAFRHGRASRKLEFLSSLTTIPVAVLGDLRLLLSRRSCGAPLMTIPVAVLGDLRLLLSRRSCGAPLTTIPVAVLGDLRLLLSRRSCGAPLTEVGLRFEEEPRLDSFLHHHPNLAEVGDESLAGRLALLIG